MRYIWLQFFKGVDNLFCDDTGLVRMKAEPTFKIDGWDWSAWFLKEAAKQCLVIVSARGEIRTSILDLALALRLHNVFMTVVEKLCSRLKEVGRGPADLLVEKQPGYVIPHFMLW